MIEKNIPAISVIIPMYNAEKYIAELLDSLLAQTFTDFEVIIADNCSTDNSAAIVESYVTKFKNGLKLIRLEKNSGAPGVPNNTGLKCARGEYISFLEADDAITKTAYEELYPVAKKFDADVVMCEKYYVLHENEPLTIAGINSDNCVTAPTLITDNFFERVQGLYTAQFVWNVWSKLVRREFIMENNLEMVNVNHHDMLYTVCLMCSAKRCVRVPNIINVYRVLEDSLSHKHENVEKTIRKYCKTLFCGFNYVEKFLSRQEFFIQNPAEKYIVLEIVIREFISCILNIYEQFPAFMIDDLIRDELEKIEDKTALTAFLFNRMNNFNVQTMQLQRQLNKAAEYLSKQQKIIQGLEK